MRMFGEVVAEHFTAEQLTMMTGIEIDAQIMQTMQDDMLRCYAIDIETDSTIQADESQERTDRMEMINNVLPLLQNIIPAINQGVMPMDMGKGILLSAVRGFKYTRGLEDMIEGLGDNMQQLQQLQQQLQEQGMQAQQMQQQYEQQMGQMQQVIQDLQGQLEQFNAQEQQRENIETQAEAEKDMAEAEKKRAEAEKIRFEQIIPPDVGNPPLLY